MKKNLKAVFWQFSEFLSGSSDNSHSLQCNVDSLHTHTHHRSQRGCSIWGKGIPARWSKAPCPEQHRSKWQSQTTSGRRGQRAGRYQSEAGAPTAGPGGFPGPDGTEWWPGCGLWSCPVLTWARPGSEYLTETSSAFHYSLHCNNVIVTITGDSGVCQ